MMGEPITIKRRGVKPRGRGRKTVNITTHGFKCTFTTGNPKTKTKTPTIAQWLNSGQPATQPALQIAVLGTTNGGADKDSILTNENRLAVG